MKQRRTAMKKTRYTETQIIKILEKVEEGHLVKE
jgi:hypothetical protein